MHRDDSVALPENSHPAPLKLWEISENISYELRQYIEWSQRCLRKKSRGSREGFNSTQLHMTILKVQVDNNMDWDDACARAAELINANSEQFKKTFKRRVQRIYNSRFMAQLNKT